MSSELPKGPSHRILKGALLFVVVAWATTFLLFLLVPDAETRGTFGDMFGAVNALFTGLAFAVVVYGLAVQRHEVKLLTEELQGSKRLAEEQQKLANLQVLAQKKQQFESTFFNLLRVFNSLVENMDLVRQSDRLQTTGRDVFPVFLDRIRSRYKKVRDDGHSGRVPLPDEDQPPSEEFYERFYKQHSSELGHYFRTLYNLFKFVDGSVLEDAEKRTYTNLIRAQLSDDEAMLLFLNGLTERGAKFKKYLEEYAVLKNVNQEDKLFIRAARKCEYSSKAFE